MEKPTAIARAWLVMLKQGGRWTQAELGEETGMPGAALGVALNAMHTRGFAVRYSENGLRRYQYGVTPTCRVPQGVTVAQMLESA
jgi:DNA-binding IclR family transcriptional regulator